MIYLIKSGILVTPLVIFFFLMGRIIRGWNLGAHCISCGARQLRIARPKGLLDHVMAVVYVKPLRCGCCRARFYVFRESTETAEPFAIPEPHRRQVFQVVFQRRNGAFHRVVIRRIALRPAHLLRRRRKPGPLTASPAILQA